MILIWLLEQANVNQLRINGNVCNVCAVQADYAI